MPAHPERRVGRVDRRGRDPDPHLAGPGSGTGRLTICSTSGPPNWVMPTPHAVATMMVAGKLVRGSVTVPPLSQDRQQLVDAAHPQVRPARAGQVVEGRRPPEAGADRDGQRPAAVRHRHLELRVVADHGQLAPGLRPSRSAALRSASSDGLPTTRSRQPVSLLIIAEIAREVPSARPPSVAKNSDCEQLYSAAPPQTAWQAASSAGMVNSGTSRPAPRPPGAPAAGRHDLQASLAAAARPAPGPPSTSTRR